MAMAPQGGQGCGSTWGCPRSCFLSGDTREQPRLGEKERQPRRMIWIRPQELISCWGSAQSWVRGSLRRARAHQASFRHVEVGMGNPFPCRCHPESEARLVRAF